MLKKISSDFAGNQFKTFLRSIDNKNLTHFTNMFFLCLSLPLLFSIMQSKRCALKHKRAHCPSNTNAKHCLFCPFCLPKFGIALFSSCLHWSIGIYTENFSLISQKPRISLRNDGQTPRKSSIVMQIHCTRSTKISVTNTF